MVQVKLGPSSQLPSAWRVITGLSPFDDNPDYWGRSINGVTIRPSQASTDPDSLIRFSCDTFFISYDRRRIVEDFQRRGIAVLQVLSIDDLTTGRARIDFRSIAIEDLLGRMRSPPIQSF